MAPMGPTMDGAPALQIEGSRPIGEGQRDRSNAAVHYKVHVGRSPAAYRVTGQGVTRMKLSGHQINSNLRQKLEMPTGRHLYVVLGTYERLERYERVDF